MKSSQVISLIKCLYKTDVLRTISVPIIRDLICERNPQCIIYIPPQTIYHSGQPMRELVDGVTFLPLLILPHPLVCL